MNYLNSNKISESFRTKAIDLNDKRILITNFENSDQEKDFTEPANCHGFGRIRHFKLSDETDWPLNPLPILPALKALKLAKSEILRAQVFQNSVCNWRCWYCFVDFKLLSGNKSYSDFLSCETLLDYYLEQDNPPAVIDLTGGQPDLTPEWTVWMMEALNSKGLSKSVYLWSDDNLSNDYLWRFLTPKQLTLIQNYPMYGRVCCFKGIDELSFSYNTGAPPSLFHNQFVIWERLLKLGIDLYSYLTLPSPTTNDLKGSINKFFDRIQNIDEMYPLRIVPLKIQKFLPVVGRIKAVHEDLLEGQQMAIYLWKEELEKRFSKEMIDKDITEIPTKFQRYE